MSYDYAAENNGWAIGAAQGVRRGREDGYRMGWDDACDEWRPHFEKLTDERDQAIAERDHAINMHNELVLQMRKMGQEHQQLVKAFYSVLCTLESAMDVLEDAPQVMRTDMMCEYARRYDALEKKGMIDCAPQDNGVLRTVARNTADKLVGWYYQASADIDREEAEAAARAQQQADKAAPATAQMAAGR